MTILLLIIFFVAAFCFMFLNDRTTSPKGKTIATVILIILFEILNFGICSTQELPFEVFLAVQPLVIPLLLYSWHTISADTKRRAEEEKIDNNNKRIAFYDECQKSGVAQCKSEKEIQKVALIAQKYGLQYSDITILLNDAKESWEQHNQAIKAAEINTSKKQERSQCDQLNKYANLHGRDKRITILAEERNEILKKAEICDEVPKLAYASQQKELDWAVHGGLASGIGGPAAGVAAAMDVQAKNAAIRAQNEANRAAYAPMISSALHLSNEYRDKASRLLKEIEDTETKLISDNNPKAYLSKLKFYNTKIEVSETGTCTVTTSAKLNAPFVIFDDVPALIDGTVNAEIYDGNTLIGTAFLVLPTYGIRYGKSSETALKGMALYCGTPGKEYTAKFTAKDLWAMEI